MFLVLAVAIVALRPGAPTVAAPAAAAPKGSAAALAGALDVRHPRRVAIVVLENHGYGQVIGSPHAPYLTGLAHRSTLFTDYSAITHPSLPNYLALVGGSTFGVRKDCSTCRFSEPNLITQLDARHVGWRAYFQSLPRRGYLGGPTQHLHRRSARYGRSYDPFVYFANVRRQAANRNRLVSFRALSTALDHRSLPAFSWIAPDLRHDGHSRSLVASDAYLHRLLPRVLRALGPRGVLFVTWDESEHRPGTPIGGGRGGRVALIAAGGAVDHGVRIAHPANHYTLLHTVQHIFRVPSLEHLEATARPRPS